MVVPPSLKPLVICPLRFEMNHLSASLSDRFDFICTGPGEAHIRRWAERHDGGNRPVILAGLAGSLTEGFRAGAAAVITEVVDAQSRQRWRPTFCDWSAGQPRHCVITSSGGVVGDSMARDQLQQQTAAHLVDLESVAFATVASKAGLRWAVVRGVSDDPVTGVHPAVAGLVDDMGRTRVLAAVGLAMRSPRSVPGLVRLARNARRALGEVRILLGNTWFGASR